MGANDPLGHGQFRPQEHGWQDICRMDGWMDILFRDAQP